MAGRADGVLLPPAGSYLGRCAAPEHVPPTIAPRVYRAAILDSHDVPPDGVRHVLVLVFGRAGHWVPPLILADTGARRQALRKTSSLRGGGFEDYRRHFQFPLGLLYRAVQCARLWTYPPKRRPPSTADVGVETY